MSKKTIQEVLNTIASFTYDVAINIIANQLVLIPILTFANISGASWIIVSLILGGTLLKLISRII